jgi:hypothetical protein
LYGYVMIMNACVLSYVMIICLCYDCLRMLML